jgi:hypothetical protein
MFVFDEKEPTILCEIMGRNQSDKGSSNITFSHHNYTTLYYSLFKDMQQKTMRVFELGLGTNNINLPSNMGANGRPGASLFGWREFFPMAKIFGADIDSQILFASENIKTYYCDQTSPDSIKKLWSEEDLQDNFDIMIEDGLHEYHANVCFFENSIHKLLKNGYYIIEDINNNELPLFKSKIESWKNTYPHLSFDLVTIPSVVNRFDNTLLVVKYN